MPPLSLIASAVSAARGRRVVVPPPAGGGGGSGPSWLTASLNTWGTIPGTNLSSLSGSFTDPLGSTPQGGIRKDNITAYGGIAVWTGTILISGTPVTGTWIIYHGGGHTDYAGNEILAVRIDVDSPSPAIVIGPTPNGSVTADVRYYADGRPSSTHTYWELAVINGYLMRMGSGSRYQNGGSSQWVDGANLGTASWMGSGTFTDMPGLHFTDDGACMDSSGRYWSYQQGGTLYRYTPGSGTSGSWSSFGVAAVASKVSMAHDSTRDRIVCFDTTYGSVITNLSGTPTRTGITFTGTQAANAALACSSVYVPDIDRFLLWRWGSGDQNVYQVHPTTWDVSIYSLSGTPPRKSSHLSDGAGWNNTYSRFNIIPALKIVICQSDFPYSTNFSYFRYA